jgi:predicted kinase
MHPGPPLLVLTCGVSGSGKTTVAQGLLERLGAVRLRSDLERKRLHGLSPDAREGGTRLYDATATRRTYERLAAVAELALGAGYTIVIDAACLRQAERRTLIETARRAQARCAIVACEAPVAVLQARVVQRRAAGRDASDATVQVLDQQLARREPLDADERALAIVLDTDTDLATLEARIALVAQRLSGQSLQEAMI